MEKKLKKFKNQLGWKKKEDEKQLVSIVAKKIQKPAWMEKKKKRIKKY